MTLTVAKIAAAMPFAGVIGAPKEKRNMYPPVRLGVIGAADDLAAA